MRKRFGTLCASFVALTLGLGFLLSGPAIANNNGTVSVTFTQVGTGGTASVGPLGTQSICQIHVFGPPSGPGGVQGTVQVAPDNVTWSASPNFGGINAAGLYLSSGTVSVSGSYMRFYNSGSGTVTGVLTCGTSLPPSDNPNWDAFGSPSPGPLASCATGTTANTYCTIQSLPITLGPSFGPVGQWLVTVTEDVELPGTAPTAAGPANPCISISGSPSPVPSTLFFDAAPSNTPAASFPCASPVAALTNALAGGEPFAFATTGVAFGENAQSRSIQWTGTVAPNSAWTFLCSVDGGTTTSMTILGACRVFAIPI